MTSITSATTIHPVTSVTNAGAGTITTGLLNPTCETCLSEHHLNIFDVAEKVFNQCFSKGDFGSILALGCTNKDISENIRALAQRINLIELCPGLAILDAEIQGFKV